MMLRDSKDEKVKKGKPLEWKQGQWEAQKL